MTGFKLQEFLPFFHMIFLGSPLYVASPFLPTVAVIQFFGRSILCVAMFQLQSHPTNLSPPQGLVCCKSCSQSVNISGCEDLAHQLQDTRISFAALEPELYDRTKENNRTNQKPTNQPKILGSMRSRHQHLRFSSVENSRGGEGLESG